MDQKPWLIISYYTKDTPYEDLAKQLEQNLKDLNLSYEFCGFTNLGSWTLNCNIKPKFLSLMLDKYPNYHLLYIDSDTQILSNPFIKMDFDIGMHYYKYVEYLTGVMYLNNTVQTIKLIDAWVKAAYGNNKSPDQKILNKLISMQRYKVKLYNLPRQYACTQLMRSVENPIIKCDFASRRFKAIINGNTTETI